MSPDTAQHALTSLLIVALGIEVYAEFKGGNFPPRPARFVGVCLVYGILAMAVALNGNFAVALGAGLLIMLVIKLPKITANSSGASDSLSKGNGSNPAVLA